MRKLKHYQLIALFGIIILSRFFVSYFFISSFVPLTNLIPSIFIANDLRNFFIFPNFNMTIVLYGFISIYFNYEIISSCINNDNNYLMLELHRLNDRFYLWQISIKRTVLSMLAAILLYALSFIIFSSLVLNGDFSDLGQIIATAIKEQLLLLTVSIASLFISLNAGKRKADIFGVIVLLFIVFADIAIKKISLFMMAGNLGEEIIYIIVYLIMISIFGIMFKGFKTDIYSE